MKVLYDLSTFKLIFLSLLLVFLAGCLPSHGRHGAVAPNITASEYVSEIDLPEAKATFAYGQYRLLATEGRWREALEALERAVAIDRESLYLRMSLARAYLHTRQQERAITVLREMLQVSPDHTDGHELLGDLLLQQDQYEEAIKHYRFALAGRERIAPLRLKLAMALASHGDLSAAIAEAEGMLQDNPESLAARLALARYYKEDRQFSEAIKLYREILELRPDQTQSILEFGQLLEQLNRVDEALELYGTAVDRDPRDVVVRDQMSRLLVTLGRYSEALQLLYEMDNLKPNQIRLLGRIGLLQFEMQFWLEAELTFRKILRLDPEDDRSRYYLGLALSGRGEFEQALDVLETVNVASNLRVEAVTQRAFLYQKNGQPQEAIDLLQGELDSGREDAIFYYYLAASLMIVERMEDAESLLIEGIAKHAESVNLRYQLGVLYEKMERRDDANREMLGVLAIDPDHADALNYIAYLKAERGEDLEQALIEAKRALEKKEEGYILDTLGWIYFKLGRYEEGRYSLEKAYELRPHDTVVLEHLGDLYRALGLWEDAADTYRKVLQLDPLSETAKEKLESLPQGSGQ